MGRRDESRFLKDIYWEDAMNRVSTKDTYWEDAMNRVSTKDTYWEDAMNRVSTKDTYWEDAMNRVSTKDTYWRNTANYNFTKVYKNKIYAGKISKKIKTGGNFALIFSKERLKLKRI